MPFNIGPLELILILAIALLVIGPGKLPSVGKSIGESIREFRKATTEVQEATKLDVTPAPAPAAPAPAPAPVAPVSAQAAAPAAPAPAVEPAAPGPLVEPAPAAGPQETGSAAAGTGSEPSAQA
jgi:TatA/E family protein of Tat protein translocase